MDSSKYKTCTTSRGYTYRYYHALPAVADKPTLLFIHGFPSSSFDWNRQVAHFQPLGYGIIIPDCLGYGGTDKPTEYTEFRQLSLADDIADVVEAAGAREVIAIGHDWGSSTLTGLIPKHQDRFRGFAWVGLAFVPPTLQPFDIDKTIAALHQATGNDSMGYWKLFCHPDGYKLCEQHIDSFMQLVYPANPDVWGEHLGPLGAMEAWLNADRKPGRTAWLTEEEYTTMRAELVRNGLMSAVNYYKAMVENANLEEHRAIPPEAWTVKKPALFIATMREAPSAAAMGKAAMQKYAPGSEVVELETGHWPQMEATEKFNTVLEKWLQSVVASGE